MNEAEALAAMIPPAGHRPSKPYRGGVIQIHLTRACDKACFGCTQGSNLGGRLSFMEPEQFEQAVLSLKGYWGVYGVFGGNPALSPHFEACCAILRKHVPREQRGIWCNHPLGKGRTMAATFDPAVSNLNVHLDHEAYRQFKRDWPECNPVGLAQDSRHSPPYVAFKDVEPDEGKRWEKIAACEINQRWSAMIGVFRGQLRAWFCELAGAQSLIHQDEPDYPDTGTPIDPASAAATFMVFGKAWWELPMIAFGHQARKHCHDCGIPLQGYGELAQSRDGKEQVSETHAAVYKTKRRGRAVELVTLREQLHEGVVENVTRYLQNASL